MRPIVAALSASMLIFACAAPLSPPAGFSYQVPPQPEAASGYTVKTGWKTHTFAVAAANPLATDAGDQILRAGGSAVDAAITVQMVLSLVEPQSSGIAGGAFMLHYDGRMDETYIKVAGKWKYLYRAVDRAGDTVDFLLTAGCDSK